MKQLPNENYATLKYLTAFLVLVMLEEEANKMSAMALAIVFGPTMFRYVVSVIVETLPCVFSLSTCAGRHLYAVKCAR